MYEMINEFDTAKVIHAENVIQSYKCDQMPVIGELEPKPNPNKDAGIVKNRKEVGRKKMIIRGKEEEDAIV